MSLLAGTKFDPKTIVLLCVPIAFYYIIAALALNLIPISMALQTMHGQELKTIESGEEY